MGQKRGKSVAALNSFQRSIHSLVDNDVHSLRVKIIKEGYSDTLSLWPVAATSHALPTNSTSKRRTESGGITQEPANTT